MKSFPPADSATRVLLVDAESSLRKTLETFLADEGYQLHTAENRQEAAEQVRSTSIDLVLMNMLMPHAEGIGTIIAVRSVCPEIKIIAMSGATNSDAGHFLPLAKSLGATALLPDALDHDKLLATIRSVLVQEMHQVAC